MKPMSLNHPALQTPTLSGWIILLAFLLGLPAGSLQAASSTQQKKTVASKSHSGNHSVKRGTKAHEGDRTKDWSRQDTLSWEASSLPADSRSLQTLRLSPAKFRNTLHTATRPGKKRFNADPFHASPANSHAPYRLHQSSGQDTFDAKKPAIPAETGSADMKAGEKPSTPGYAIGPARFTFNYEKDNDRTYEKTAKRLSGKSSGDAGFDQLVESGSDRDNYNLGMEYAAGNGRINAGVNLIRIRGQKRNGDTDAGDASDLRTYSLGYTMDVSDTTSLYGSVSRTEYDKQSMSPGNRGNGTGDDSVTGFRFGMMHKF